MGQAKNRKATIDELKKTPKMKKELGQVFTPIALVDEILSKLPEDNWKIDKTYLDPACGNGNFLVRVIERKVEKGANVWQALMTTYGVEIDQEHRNACVERIKELAKKLFDKVPSTLFVVGGNELFLDTIVEANIQCDNTLTGKWNSRCIDWVNSPFWKMVTTVDLE